MSRSTSVRVLWLMALGAGCLTPVARAAQPVQEQRTPPIEPKSVPAYARPGPFEVQTVTYDWTDPARQRQVPVKVYYPERASGPLPVIIFSHGLGGSREGYQYLGGHWASHGYVSVHVQHPGSDETVWKGLGIRAREEMLSALRRAMLDPRNALDRPRDVSFAIDQMAKLNGEDSRFRARLDMGRIGVAGHSFGAYTTLAVVGQVGIGPLGRELSLADPRVQAAIPMSAPAPRRRDRLDQVYGKIRVPCLHMTGTLDDSPLGDTQVSERRIPFDHIVGADQYLLILNGGDHMVFSGHPRLRGSGEKDQRFQQLIAACSTAFWDAYLKGDSQAKSFLAQNGFETMLGPDGMFEKKLK